MAIRVVARDHIKPECIEEALKLVREMVECTHKEEGNISYDYYQDVNSPEFFAMIECWESEEVLQKHMQSEHFCRLIPQLGAMAAEPTRIEVYKEVL